MRGSCYLKGTALPKRRSLAAFPIAQISSPFSKKTIKLPRFSIKNQYQNNSFCNHLFRYQDFLFYLFY